MPDIFLRSVPSDADPDDLRLRDPTTGDGGSSPQTLTATANAILATAGAAVLLATITLAAGTNTVTVTAPTATLVASTTIAAGSNTATVTAPTAGVLAQTTLVAGANVVTMEAPTALLSAGTGGGATVRRYYRGIPRDSRAVMVAQKFYYVDE